MLLILLYLLWIIFNARITAEVLFIGLPVAGIVYFFSLKAFGWSVKKDFSALRRLPSLLGYLLFLWKEVLLSALRVMRRIWTPGQPDSAVVSYDPELRTLPARVLLADSITLTPGTITLEAEDKQLQVHCLDRSSGEGLISGPLRRKVIKWEEGLRHG